MNQANFEKARRAFMRRHPFLPLIVESNNGDRIRIPHPEALVMRGPIAMFIGPDSAVKLFDGESITQLTDEPSPTS
jgi:hypothetical protein